MCAKYFALSEAERVAWVPTHTERVEFKLDTDHIHIFRTLQHTLMRNLEPRLGLTSEYGICFKKFARGLKASRDLRFLRLITYPGRQSILDTINAEANRGNQTPSQAEESARQWIFGAYRLLRYLPSTVSSVLTVLELDLRDESL